MWRDMERECVKYGLPVIRKPEVFPGNGLLAARVATLGMDQPWCADFVRGVYLVQFAQGRGPWGMLAPLQAAGLFGAPSFTAPDGEVFWGNDRLEDAIAWVVG